MKSVIDEAIPEKSGFTVIIPCAFPIKENDINPKFPFNKNDSEYKNFNKNLLEVFAVLPEVSSNEKKLSKFFYKTSDAFIDLNLINEEKSNELVLSVKNGKTSKDIKSKFCALKDENIKSAEGKNLLEILKNKIANGEKLIDDKITQSQKVCIEILRTPKQSENATLSIKYCVYLPLQKPDDFQVEINSKYDYTILIDGSFVIDQGRQGIEGFEHLSSKLTAEDVARVSSSDWASQVWNQIVAQNLVFPSLPKIFEKAKESGVIENSIDFSEILNGLFKLLLSKNGKNLINNFTTSLYGFAKTYDFDFQKNKVLTNWTFLDWYETKCENIVYIPEVLNLENVLSVFPSIKNKNPEIIFVAGNKFSNYLLPKDCATSSEILQKLISDFSKENITNRQQIEILSEFLDSNKGSFQNNLELCKILIQKIKSLLSQTSLAELSSVQLAFSKLCKNINEITGESEFKIFSVDKKELSTLKIPEQEWKKMWLAESGFVFVPGFIKTDLNLTEEQTRTLVLGTEENREKSVCQFLIQNGISGESQHEILDDLTGGKLKNYIKEIIAKFGKIKIFGIINIKTKNKLEYKSSEEFFELLRNYRIFKSVGTTVKESEPVFVYANLMPDFPIFSLYRKEDIENFGIDENDKKYLLENDFSSALESLKNQDYENLNYYDDYKAKFANEALRNPFIIDFAERNFYRFILARFQKIYDNKTLCIFATECDKRWKKVFEICKSSDYVLVPKEFDDCVKFAKKNERNLEINFVTNDICFRQLNVFSWNNSLDFILKDDELHSQEFLTSILEKISFEHETLFRKLPFQKNFVTGETVCPITDDCYLNKGEIKFPEGFSTRRILVKMDENPRIREFQEKFMRDKILTAGKAVRFVLEEKSNDEDYSNWIFENLNNPENTKQEFEEIRKTVWQKKWIPTKDKTFCALNEISSKNLLSQNSLDAICVNFGFYTLDVLAISSDNKNFLERKNNLIQNCLPELFGILAEKISKTNDFFVQFDSTEELQSAARNLDSAVEFPLFHIVSELFEDEKISNKEIIFSDFYQKITLPEPSLEQNLETLKYLNGKEEITDGVLNLFCRILKKAVNQNGFEISEVKYPNKKREWKNAGEIANSTSDAIEDEFLLDGKVYEILRDKISSVFVPKSDEENSKFSLTENSSVSQIDEFFEAWRKKSDHSKLVDLALYLLRGNFRNSACAHTKSELFSILLQFKTQTPILDSEYWCHGYSKPEEFFLNSGYRNYFKTFVQIPNGKTIRMPSLQGKDIDVAIKITDFSNPVLFKPFYVHGENKIWLQLSTIPLSAKTTDEYAKSLIRQILKNCYFQENDYEITRLIENFCNSSQRTIEGTKERIFDELFGILPTLGVKNKDFEEMNAELSDCYDKKNARTWDEIQFATARAQIVRNLVERIRTDEELKTAVFEAVKNKVHMNHYMPESVLFELFQNADDSVNDFELCGKNIDEKKRIFEVRFSQNKITTIHYGRCINDSLGTENNELAGRFHQDLLNMLSLNASDKDSSSTGKFGLGFKSIYKICDEPVIRSGELNFKIIAGIYPENIPSDSSVDASATQIELNLQNVKVSDVIEKFKDYAKYLSIFSKQIREIKIAKIDPKIDPKTDKIKMNFDSVFKNDQNQISKVQNDSNGNELYYLFEKFDGKNKYKILFGTENGKIVSLQNSDVPKLWCVTPLESVKNLPFLMNADFTVDTGRNNLAGNDKENQEKLEIIATNFANLLCASKSTLEEPVFDGIANLLVQTSNMQEYQFSEFKKFAKDALEIIQNKTGEIPTGFDSTIKLENYEKIFYVAPSRYTDSNENNLMISVQNYFDFANPKIAVITKSASDSLSKNIPRKIDLLNLEDIFDFAKNGNLTTKILLFAKSISDSIRNYGLMGKIDLRNLNLKNSSGEWISCNEITLSDVSGEYSEEAKSFLGENNIFTENENRNLWEKYSDLQKENENLKLQNQNQPQKPGIISDNSLPSPVSKVYNWWHEENESGKWKDDVEKYYEQKHFPSIFGFGLQADAFKYAPEKLFALKEDEIPNDWCLLLWVAAAQSMPYNWGNRDAANENGIETLKQIGVFDDFCSGVNLEEVYNKYLDSTETDETRIRLFEMLLRIHKYRRNFAYYYDLWKNLPAKQNDNSIESFLVPSDDEELSGCGINLSPGNRTFSVGYRLIIQNLSLCGFWKDASEVQMKKLFKEFRALKDYEFNLDGKNDAKEFYSALDLPFQVYEEKKKNGEIND